MDNKPFFDEETVEKVREHDKEQYELNRKKSDFNKINTAVDSYNKYSFENEELLKAYVGDKYKSFMTKNFNIWAFLFGSFYMLYRKMYLYGFLLALFTSIVNSYFLKINISNISVAGTLVRVNLTSILLTLVFHLILNIIIAISFNKLYIGLCVNDITRLKKEYPTLDTKELCRKKGGTSLILAIVANILISIVVSFIMNFF